jgi:hypothetical protein
MEMLFEHFVILKDVIREKNEKLGAAYTIFYKKAIFVWIKSLLFAQELSTLGEDYPACFRRWLARHAHV